MTAHGGFEPSAMRVSAINLYPVKATKGIPVPSADVEPWGLRHDRRWAIVDLEGSRVDARSHDTLLAVSAIPDSDGGLMLTAEGREPLAVAAPVGGHRLPVDVSRFPEAVDAGDAAAWWFSSYLDKDVRLVWQDDPARRTVSLKRGGTGSESLSLADAGPLLLTSTASLERLNDWIGGEEMVMERFRPNVVVEGNEPFSEDSWKQILIGDVRYRFAELCDRCVITTIDPETLEHGKEPIRTLAQRRQWEHKTWFGVRIIPLTTGSLRIGDAVRVTVG